LEKSLVKANSFFIKKHTSKQSIINYQETRQQSIINF